MLAAVGLETLEEVDWARTTKEAVALYEQSTPQIEWRMSIPEVPVVIDGSKAYLTRAMNNLITNAIDAVADEPHPSIAIGLEVSPEGKALLTVEDNGIGIPEDKQKEIFQPHFTSKEKGTGLGLFITDSIVRQLNGRITVRSFPGQGSVFGLEFLVK
jgi:signal transduction histidine kinase